MKNILSIIHWPAFLSSFVLGLVYILYLDPKRSITVYPTPENVDQVQYKTDNGLMFAYRAHKVKCPSAGEITEYPTE